MLPSWILPLATRLVCVARWCLSLWTPVTSPAFCWKRAQKLQRHCDIRFYRFCCWFFWAVQWFSWRCLQDGHSAFSCFPISDPKGVFPSRNPNVRSSFFRYIDAHLLSLAHFSIQGSQFFSQSVSFSQKILFFCCQMFLLSFALHSGIALFGGGLLHDLESGPRLRAIRNECSNAESERATCWCRIPLLGGRIGRCGSIACRRSVVRCSMFTAFGEGHRSLARKVLRLFRRCLVRVLCEIGDGETVAVVSVGEGGGTWWLFYNLNWMSD